MTPITTHVLDVSTGRPAKGVKITLEAQTAGGWSQLGTASTDADGRAMNLTSDGINIPAGTCRLRFDVGAYFAARKVACLYPYVEVAFTSRPAEHYHLPLLVSPFGYSTYRGS